MDKFFEAPEGFHKNRKQYLDVAQRDIGNYTAIMVFKGVCGSGTFATSNGHFGILTCHHVSKEIFRDAGTPVRLVVASHEHDLFFNSDTAQEVVVGKFNANTAADGPDLSFIIIRDQKLLATIKSIKSFYVLDNKKLSYLSDPQYYKNFYWQLSGSPQEFWKPVVEGGQQVAMAVANLVMETVFESYQTRDQFDFMELEVDTDKPHYPKAYQGVSGGGMWLTPLEADGDEDNPINIAPAMPVLSGVAFYARLKEGNETDYQIITGHGWKSIYTNVRQALKDIPN